jgi:alcohol dehydrogenase class IV
VFLEWVLSLRKEIGIPNDLSAIIDDDQRYDEIGKMAVKDPSASTNPIQHDVKAYTQIVTSAFKGDL